MQHAKASKTARLPTVIETISSGFTIVNRSLWVVLVPLVLDLAYWFGPRASVQPLWDQSARLLQQVNPEDWAQIQQQLGTALQLPPVPLWRFVVPGIPQFITLLGPLITQPASPLASPLWNIGDLLSLFGLLAAVNVAGLAATWLYLWLLARRVRIEVPAGARRTPRLVSLVTIVLIVAGAVLVAAVPFVIAAMLLTLLSPAIGTLVLFVFGMLFFWLLFTTSFSFDAVMVSGVGPLRALLISMLMVRHSFWGVAGLLVVGWLITHGLSIVWQTAAASPIGLVVAIVGSAYITSGLAAAHLVFYRDRLGTLPRRVW